jgi:YtkA-like
MRRLWWFVIGGGVVLAGLLVVLGFAFLGGGDDGTDVANEPCRPSEAGPSAGNANIQARALGRGFLREIVIHVTDKESGEPVRGAQVTVQGTMECPHFMPFHEKKLRETATGTYKGDYQLVMPGEGNFTIVVRSRESGSTTASLPFTMKIRR